MENNIGKNIQAIRKQMQLSQDALARKADIKLTTLFKIEQGRTKNPSVWCMHKIAKALNVSIETLLGKVIYINEEKLTDDV